jgi:N-acylneuraminate cytidylyltransferase
MIDQIIVNSNDKTIREQATNRGVEVCGRPDRFAKANKLMEVDRLLSWQVEELEKQGHVIDVIVILYPSSPLRTVNNIDKTIRLVTKEEYDSALTLHEDARYLWKNENGTVTPDNYDPQRRGPEHLEDWNQWIETKDIYVVNKDILIEQGCRVGGNIGYTEVPAHRSINIDSEFDFKLAQFIAEVDGASW